MRATEGGSRGKDFRHIKKTGDEGSKGNRGLGALMADGTVGEPN